MLKIESKEYVEGKNEVSQKVEQKHENWKRKENWRIGLGSPISWSSEIHKDKVNESEKIVKERNWDFPEQKYLSF